jgi:hypothetical protein
MYRVLRLYRSFRQCVSVACFLGFAAGFPWRPAIAQNGPPFFGWEDLYSIDSGNTDTNTSTYVGYSPVPMMWHFDPMISGIPSPRARKTYLWQQQAASATSPTAARVIFAHQDSAVVVGGNAADANDIAATLAWLGTQGYTLDYAFDDFEGQGNGDWANIFNYVNQVRASTVGTSAGIGSYSKFPAPVDLSQPYPNEADHRTENTYYATNAASGAAGLNVAMPASYMAQYYCSHADDAYSWGSSWWSVRSGLSASDQQYLAGFLTYNQLAATTAAYMSPNERAAMFYGPLEEFSVARRNLPAGQRIIPWVSAYIPNAGNDVPPLLPGQAPTQQDNEALLEHLRLRGAHGFYAFGDNEIAAYSGTYSDGTPYSIGSYQSYSADMQATWHGMDWFFSLPTQVGTVTADGPVNLVTFKNAGGSYVDPGGKNGGIEWSAYQRGNRVLALISNLGNADQSPTGTGTGNQGNWQSVIGALNAGLASQPPVVPAGNHLVLQFLTDVAVSDFNAYSLNTVLGASQGWDTSAADFLVTPASGTGDGANRVVSINHGAALAWFSNATTANPGGIGATANDRMMYLFKVFTGWSGSGNASFAPVVGSGAAVPVPSQQNGPTLWAYVGGTSNYWAFGNNYASGGPYHSLNFAPAANTWYSVEMILDPSTSLTTIYAKNLTAGDSGWTLLHFDDTRTQPIEDLVEISAELIAGEENPSLYNGFQIGGSAGAQFDDMSAQLYLYPPSPLSSYSPPPLATPAGDVTGGDGPLPLWALGALGAGLFGAARRRLSGARQ